MPAVCQQSEELLLERAACKFKKVYYCMRLTPSTLTILPVQCAWRTSPTLALKNEKENDFID